MTQVTFKQQVKDLLKERNIPESLLGARENFVGAKETAIDIMIMAGMPKRVALAAIYGVQNSAKCEISSYLTDVWNFCQMYDFFCLDYCIKLAVKYVENDENCEVGLKYPQFNADVLIKRYGINKTGVYEPEFSRERTKKSEKTYYEVWENEDKTISFSFEKGRMGEGGYAGATFPTFEKAICFVEWFFQNPANFVKDVDLFYNRLGGLGLDKLVEYRNETVIA